jgi:hypothetical protein
MDKEKVLYIHNGVFFSHKEERSIFTAWGAGNVSLLSPIHPSMLNSFPNNCHYYLEKKKNEIMSLAGKWMELEIIMLCEISQTQKDKYHMFFFSDA